MTTDVLLLTRYERLGASSRVRFLQFLRFDAAGAALYVGAYGIGGFVFSDLLRAITRGLKSAGSAAEIVAGS